jgi:hypothetical protein
MGKTTSEKASMRRMEAQIFYIESYETFRTEHKGEWNEREE